LCSRVIACIPAYNEEERIGKIVNEVLKHVNEVLVIDCGSLDNTRGEAEAAGATVIEAVGDGTYGNALIVGFKEALRRGADIVVSIDTDVRYNLEALPALLKPIVENKADVVIGSRYLPEGRIRGLSRKFLTWLLRRHRNLKNVTDGQSGFRAYRREVLEKVKPKGDDPSLAIEILVRAASHGFRIMEVPAGSMERRHGVERLRFLHLLALLISVFAILAHEDPVRFLTFPGIISIISGLFLLMFTVYVSVLPWIALLASFFSLFLVIFGVAASVISLSIYLFRREG